MIKINEIIAKIDPSIDYTIAEVAEMTGLSYSCIIGHIKRGNVPDKLIFSKRYINGKILLDYLKGKNN